MDKTELRKWAKEKRLKLDMKGLSVILTEKLSNSDEYKSSENIMIFYPLKGEPDLLKLTEDKTKNFYLPKIKGQSLLCCRFDENTELCESCFHTKEPALQNSPKEETIPDLIIVPALAADRKNYRLGYGGGFYDRFLGELKKNGQKIKTIVCIPKELVVDTIYPNEYDIRIDKIITA